MLINFSEFINSNKKVAIIFYNTKNLSKNYIDIKNYLDENKIETKLINVEDAEDAIEIAIQYYIETLPAVLFFMNHKYIYDLTIENATLDKIKNIINRLKNPKYFSKIVK